DPAAAAALCAANNDWLAQYCSADPRRLIGVALLPQQDPTLAVAELERCVEQHDFVGGVIRPNRIAGRTVDDEAFEPLWASAAALGWANRVCFASDYPHFASVYPGAVDAVRAHGLDPKVERRVLADNALEFYGERLRRLVA